MALPIEILDCLFQLVDQYDDVFFWTLRFDEPSDFGQILLQVMRVELLHFDLFIRSDHLVYFEMKILLVVGFDIKRAEVEYFTVKIDIILHVLGEVLLFQPKYIIQKLECLVAERYFDLILHLSHKGWQDVCCFNFGIKFNAFDKISCSKDVIDV